MFKEKIKSPSSLSEKEKINQMFWKNFYLKLWEALNITKDFSWKLFSNEDLIENVKEHYSNWSCAEFALMTHKYLKKQGIETKIGIAYIDVNYWAPDEWEPYTAPLLLHVFLELKNSKDKEYYDIFWEKTNEYLQKYWLNEVPNYIQNNELQPDYDTIYWPYVNYVDSEEELRKHSTIQQNKLAGKQIEILERVFNNL